MKDNVDDVLDAYEEILPILKEHSQFVQGAILVNLVANWIVSHRSKDSELTPELREELLEIHIEFVRQAMPIHD